MSKVVIEKNMKKDIAMTVGYFVLKELLHRKLNFFLSLLSVALATGCFVCAAGFLRLFDVGTERIIAGKEREAKNLADSLQEEYRIIGTKMGFNILILPVKQHLEELYAEDYASECMPEWYVDTLAHSGIITVQHLLPVLQRKVKWTEARRTIIVVGTRGEVPLLHAEMKKPIAEPVLPGTIILGSELCAAGRGLKVGGRVQMLGRRFKVVRCCDERGTKDDITAWINLCEAQGMFNKKGLINGIMGLECNCAMANVALIRQEIGRVLPGTQVVEFSSKALARAESRAKAAAFARQSVDSEKQNRLRLRAEKERFCSALLFVILLACSLWVCLLAFANVRDRRAEIGIFRALGYRSATVLAVFLARAFFIGMAGACIGIGTGITAGIAVHLSRSGSLKVFAEPVEFFLILLGTPLLSVLACWLPSIAAVNQDPAAALRKE